MPEFPGGEKEMMNYLHKNTRYPTAARENGIEGTVMLEFVVNEDGSISGLKALRQVSGGCTEEAMRVVKSMPKWKAGMQNGNAVKVYFRLPVTFKLGG
jgi:protein TonB